MIQSDTPRLNEVLDGKWHGNAIEYLARDLERELNIALAERDAAREDAERLVGLLKRHDEMRRKAENQSRSKEGYREFPICKETREALAVHEAITKK